MSNHNVRRSPTGDYYCSCGRQWDADEGDACPGEGLTEQDAERAAFELAYRRQCVENGCPQLPQLRIVGGSKHARYADAIEQAMWEGWQARASLLVGVPDGYRLIRIEHFDAIKAQLNPKQVDAYRGRNIYDEDKVYANWSACASALDEIKDVFQQVDWDAENDLPELLAATTVKAELTRCSDCMCGGGEFHGHTAECQYEHFLAYSGLQEDPMTRYAYIKGLGGDCEKPAPSLPPAGVEEVEVAGWRVTGGGGLTVTPQQPVWAEGDSSLCIDQLMTVAQHQRIVAGLRQDLDYFPPTVRALTETIAEMREEIATEKARADAAVGDTERALSGRVRVDCEFVRFLLGETEIEGVAFGEEYPDTPGKFWWRTHLRALLAQAEQGGGV